MSDKKTIKRRFFTLAEVVVASGVLAIVTSGLFGSVIMATHMIANARLRNEASMLVFDRMWETFHLDYDTLMDYSSPVTEAVPSYSILHPVGGTLRTWALNYGDYVYIFVRADWYQPVMRGGSEYAYEYNYIYRYRSDR